MILKSELASAEQFLWSFLQMVQLTGGFGAALSWHAGAAGSLATTVCSLRASLFPHELLEVSLHDLSSRVIRLLSSSLLNSIGLIRSWVSQDSKVRVFTRVQAQGDVVHWGSPI